MNSTGSMLYFTDCERVCSTVSQYIIDGRLDTPRRAVVGDGIPHAGLIRGGHEFRYTSSFEIPSKKEFKCGLFTRGLSARAAGASQSLASNFEDESMYADTVSNMRNRRLFCENVLAPEYQKCVAKAARYTRPFPLVPAATPLKLEAEEELISYLDGLAQRCLAEEHTVYAYISQPHVREEVYSKFDALREPVDRDDTGWFMTMLTLYLFDNFINPVTHGTRESPVYSDFHIATTVKVCVTSPLPTNWYVESPVGMEVTFDDKGYGKAVSTFLSKLPPHDVINLFGDGDCIWSAIYASMSSMFDKHDMIASLSDRHAFITSIKKAISTYCVQDGGVTYNGTVPAGAPHVMSEIISYNISSAGGVVMRDVVTFFNWCFGETTMLLLEFLVTKGKLYTSERTLHELSTVAHLEGRYPIVILSNGSHAFAIRFTERERQPLGFAFDPQSGQLLTERIASPVYRQPDAHSGGFTFDVNAIFEARSMAFREMAHANAKAWVAEFCRSDPDQAVRKLLTERFKGYRTTKWPQHVTYGWDVTSYIREHVVNKNEQHPVFTNILNTRRPLALLCALVNAEWCKRNHDDEDANVRGWRQPPVSVVLPMSVSTMMSYRACDELATEALVKRTIVGLRSMNSDKTHLDGYYVKYHLGDATVSTPLVAYEDDDVEAGVNSRGCESDVTPYATGSIVDETNSTHAPICMVAVGGVIGAFLAGLLG